MTQQDLDRAVARATGESLSTVTGMGFVPLTRVPYERDADQEAADRDEFDGEHRGSAFSRRRPRPAVA